MSIEMTLFSSHFHGGKIKAIKNCPANSKSCRQQKVMQTDKQALLSPPSYPHVFIITLRDTYTYQHIVYYKRKQEGRRRRKK